MKKMYVYKVIRQGKTAKDEYGGLHFTQKPISKLMKTYTQITVGKKYAEDHKYMYSIREEEEVSE